MTRTLRHPAAGFTLVEVLVAVSILLILLSLIGILFTQTSNAVGLGTANSDLINGARGFQDQLNRDASNMRGPTSDGFLVILNKQISTRIALPTGGEATANIRVDQISFIASSTGITPMTPGDTNTFANQATAANARIWWGHCRRLNADGSDSGDLGAASGMNVLANQWLLGRQAMLLASGTLGGSAIYASDAQYNSSVNNITGGVVYRAHSDVANASLANIKAYLAAATTEADYKARAYNYIFGPERLRVNPKPSTTTFTSAQIAQMHPFFMANVSDFIVEFAADLNNNGLVDTDYVGGTDTTGSIAWYDGYNYGYPVAFTPYDGSPGLANADRAFVFRHDDINPATCKWPYLIRIRYRAHDFSGKIAGDNNTPGKWFELIFKVPRP